MSMVQDARDQLVALLGLPALVIAFDTSGPDGGVDAVVESGNWSFALQCKDSGSVAGVASAIHSLRNSGIETAIPLLVVPYMGPAGRERCAEAGVSWLDLSGNASISGPGLRIAVEGQPNRFVKRGRPANIFAPQSSRISRWFLTHPQGLVTQREVAKATRLDEGYVSRVVGRLLALDLLRRADSGELFVPDPDALLDAWAERYQFDRHKIVKGHVAARTGTDSTRRLALSLTDLGIPHAFTGLSAAWQWVHFATYRLTTVFVLDELSTTSFDKLGFRLDERGANTWIVTPNDPGVVDDSCKIDEIRCVHPVQAWLDLQAHPERASEAATELRKREMNWHE